MSIHLCRAPEIARLRRITRCGACKQRRRHVIYDNAWYGSTRVCCYCGYQIDFDAGPWRNRGKQERARRAEKARLAWAEPFDHRAEYWADYTEVAAA